MSKLRISILGAGKISQIMLPAFQRDDLVIESIVDVNESLATELAKEVPSAQVYSDYREALASSSLNAVYIATPPFLHKEMTVEAMKQNKHVLCEKPFMMSLDEIEEVAQAHQLKPHLKLACCSNRFHRSPAVDMAHDYLAQGKLGELMRVRLVSSLKPPVASEELQGWKTKKATAGGGIAMDWGVYDLDCLIHLLGGDFQPKSIYASMDYWNREGMDVESSFNAEIQCHNRLSISWERHCEHGPERNCVELRGTKGGLDLPFTPNGKPEALTLYQYNENNALSTSVLSEPLTDWRAILDEPVVDFVNAIQCDSQVASGIERQRTIQRIIDGLYASAERGASVTIL